MFYCGKAAIFCLSADITIVFILIMKWNKKMLQFKNQASVLIFIVHLFPVYSFLTLSSVALWALVSSCFSTFLLFRPSAQIKRGYDSVRNFLESFRHCLQLFKKWQTLAINNGKLCSLKHLCNSKYLCLIMNYFQGKYLKIYRRIW